MHVQVCHSKFKRAIFKYSLAMPPRSIDRRVSLYVNPVCVRVYACRIVIYDVGGAE